MTRAGTLHSASVRPTSRRRPCCSANSSGHHTTASGGTPTLPVTSRLGFPYRFKAPTSATGTSRQAWRTSKKGDSFWSRPSCSQFTRSNHVYVKPNFRSQPTRCAVGATLVVALVWVAALTRISGAGSGAHKGRPYQK